jgi:hypothetical protein
VVDAHPPATRSLCLAGTAMEATVAMYAAAFRGEQFEPDTDVEDADSSDDSDGDAYCIFPAPAAVSAAPGD